MLSLSEGFDILKGLIVNNLQFGKDVAVLNGSPQRMDFGPLSVRDGICNIVLFLVFIASTSDDDRQLF